ncbi:hypothetical protein RFI_39853 [Reticulomyxa filosa]|uniref:Uncharacterized protein n=1 Tax=Reticulomyxa filosa TaxID=46433 RepID=X6L962_RETFI|nr:hypothetical protein RFI_39853 [Reticulomyxa filosa]|eukprot:ETN97676.1 hypothetical protein RFI_39853 [Reticulomyxa filosa]
MYAAFENQTQTGETKHGGSNDSKKKTMAEIKIQIRKRSNTITSKKQHLSTFTKTKPKIKERFLPFYTRATFFSCKEKTVIIVLSVSFGLFSFFQYNIFMRSMCNTDHFDARLYNDSNQKFKNLYLFVKYANHNDRVLFTNCIISYIEIILLPLKANNVNKSFTKLKKKLMPEPKIKSLFFLRNVLCLVTETHNCHLNEKKSENDYLVCSGIFYLRFVYKLNK